MNPERAAGFARVAGAIDPDIWAFQEVGSITQGVPSSTTAELKTLLDARHNALPGGPFWTWRNNGTRFPPGRLDFITYSDSAMSPVHSFVLNTAIMTTEELLATGLQPFDALLNGDTGNFDHLPIVMDFVVVPEPGALLIAALIYVMVAGLRQGVIAG